MCTRSGVLHCGQYNAKLSTWTFKSYAYDTSEDRVTPQSICIQAKSAHSKFQVVRRLDCHELHRAQLSL
jgi:hypothetical protein